MKKQFIVFIVSVLLIQMGCKNGNSKKDDSSETAATVGIKFFNGTFKEALFKAKSENKLIFLDAYTTWCGPCKMMKQNTFPDAMVGQVFNEKYVSIAIDMEAGEGIELSQQFQIQGYPTLLFLDADGKIVKNALGFRDPAGLITLSNEI